MSLSVYPVMSKPAVGASAYVLRREAAPCRWAAARRSGRGRLLWRPLARLVRRTRGHMAPFLLDGGQAVNVLMEAAGFALLMAAFLASIFVLG